VSSSTKARTHGSQKVARVCFCFVCVFFVRVYYVSGIFACFGPHTQHPKMEERRAFFLDRYRRKKRRDETRRDETRREKKRRALLVWFGDFFSLIKTF